MARTFHEKELTIYDANIDGDGCGRDDNEHKTDEGMDGRCKCGLD